MSARQLGDARSAARGAVGELPYSASVRPLTAAALVAQWGRERRRTPDDEMGPVPRLGDGSVPTPYSTLILPTVDGQERIVMAMRCRAIEQDPNELTFLDPAERVLARGSSVPAHGEALGEILIAGLNERSQIRLLSWLLGSCGTALKISREPGFIALCDSLVRRLVPAPVTLGKVIALTDHLVLAVEPIAAELGPVRQVAVVGSAGARVSVVRRAEEGPHHLVMERQLLQRGNLLLVIGRDGFGVWRVERSARNAVSAISWMSRLGGDAPRFVTGVAPAIAAAARKEPKLRSMLWEMQLRFPWERRSAIATGGPIRADVDLAIGHGAGGLFVAGWLEDPHALVQSLWVRSVFGIARELDRPLYRVPRGESHKTGRNRSRPRRGQDDGFVTYLPGEPDPLPSLQHRVEVHLGSGTRIGLVPPLPPVSFADALVAVLSSVPPDRMTPDMLERCIGPAAAHLHAHHMERDRVDDVVTFGAPPGKPEVSVVIPLYRNLEFIRFQLGAFATDPEFGSTELLFVLDSPEQCHELTHLLEGLHLLHGVPMKLVVMRENFGFAAASNAGAQEARGNTLLMLNSDVIPERPGWLSALRTALKGKRRLGAVGPKLLYEDGSIQHAGLFFRTDHKGRWFNDHFYKGLPRGFGPANERRSVPGVTGACLMISAKLFNRLGGFAEDYIYGDYEDSDLCLKIRGEGLDIHYVPSVELYHLEWQSKPRHEGYMRSVADQYNGWLHANRWGSELAAVMDELGRSGRQAHEMPPPRAQRSQRLGVARAPARGRRKRSKRS